MRHPLAFLAVFTVFVFSACAEEPKPVTIACYNVENYLPMDRRVDGKNLKNAPKPEEEIAAVIKVITSVSPDILGIVEIGDRSMLEDLQKRLADAGLNYPHSEWVKGADEHRHVALLSKFPIVERNSRDDVPFELDGRIHRINRGILDVTVELQPDYRLRLVGAHLKSRREVSDFDQAQYRAKESWHLKQHLNAIVDADPEVNLLLFGDLNDTKNEYPIRELIGTKGTPHYMMDIWVTDSRGERWTHFWRFADIYSRIDYLMVSPALVDEVDFKNSGICDIPEWNDASDHRLIFTKVLPVNQ